MPAAAALLDLFGEDLLGKDGTVKTADALDGKSYIMVYFSAHWCPPCRGFTPKLAEAYTASAAAKGIEIVFVSSDRDEDGFKGYYGEMPWLALPFADRAKKDQLSQQYGVQGIPTLVILDANGGLVTTEGRGKVDEYFGGKSLADMFGEELVGKEGTVKVADALAGKKNIMIYFSAHWCPPCRGFTPQLAEKYKACAAANGIEVIFVSSDRDEESFNGYYGEMPWLALPFADRAKKDELSQQYGVQGIPTLVVLDGQGKLITTEGRARVDQYFGGGEKGCCIIS